MGPPDLDLLRDLLATVRGEATPDDLDRLRAAGWVDAGGGLTTAGDRAAAVLLTLLLRAVRPGP